MPIPTSDHPPYDASSESPAPRAATDESPGLITRSLSDTFNEALRRLKLYARYRFPLVLEGDSGTGKSVMARLVHGWSERAERRFHKLSLANLPDSLAASELFGHARGAFTGATDERKGGLLAANRGTIFLDEVGHASLETQAKLLEITEEGRVRALGSDRIIPVDVRLIFATSVATKDLAASGRLLPDLYARLRMWRVRLPSLSERVEDIPMLVQFFVELHARALGLERTPQVSADVVGVLCRAEWPGNVRQLGQAVNVLLVHADGARRITLDHFFGEALTEILDSAQRKRNRHSPEEVRRVYQAQGNVKRTARALGVSPNTVRAHRNGSKRGVSESEVPMPPAKEST